MFGSFLCRHKEFRVLGSCSPCSIPRQWVQTLSTSYPLPDLFSGPNPSSSLSMLNGLLELADVEDSPALQGIKAWPSERHVEQYSYPQCPQT